MTINENLIPSALMNQTVNMHENKENRVAPTYSVDTETPNVTRKLKKKKKKENQLLRYKLIKKKTYINFRQRTKKMRCFHSISHQKHSLL